MRPTSPNITLVIITKNRTLDLAKCYASLHSLSDPPDEFILVDSSTDSQTKKLTNEFAQHNLYPVRYIHESRLGYPIARNRGIKAAKCSWIMFTDDDCIVNSFWIKNMKRSIARHGHAAAIAGESKSLHPNNFVSQATMFSEWLWKNNARKGNEIWDLETLDNKNVAYNVQFLQKNHIKYDEGRSTYYFGACDDCDLGMQIQQRGGKAYYEPAAVVYHNDFTAITPFTTRFIERSLAYNAYRKKWQTYRNILQKNKEENPRFLVVFTSYCKQNGLTLLQIIVLFIMHMVYTPLLKIVVTFSSKSRDK